LTSIGKLMVGDQTLGEVEWTLENFMVGSFQNQIGSMQGNYADLHEAFSNKSFRIEGEDYWLEGSITNIDPSGHAVFKASGSSWM